MRRSVYNVAAVIGLVFCSLTAFSQDVFEKYFEAKCLRVDFALIEIGRASCRERV